jgi:hypothetical protein
MAGQNSFLLEEQAAQPKCPGSPLEAVTSSGYTPRNNHGGYWRRPSLKDDLASHAKCCKSIQVRNQWWTFQDLDDSSPWIFKLSSAE